MRELTIVGRRGSIEAAEERALRNSFTIKLSYSFRNDGRANRMPHKEANNRRRRTATYHPRPHSFCNLYGRPPYLPPTIQRFPTNSTNISAVGRVPLLGLPSIDNHITLPVRERLNAMGNDDDERDARNEDKSTAGFYPHCCSSTETTTTKSPTSIIRATITTEVMKTEEYHHRLLHHTTHRRYWHSNVCKY